MYVSHPKTISATKTITAATGEVLDNFIHTLRGIGDMVAEFDDSLMGVGSYALSSSNIFGLLAFSGSTTRNLVFGVVSAAISFAGGFFISLLLNGMLKKGTAGIKNNE